MTPRMLEKVALENQWLDAMEKSLAAKTREEWNHWVKVRRELSGKIQELARPEC